MATDRCVPGKRLRNWHRRHGLGMSLREFVRAVAAELPPTVGERLAADGARVAKLWLASKGARP